MIKVFSVTKGQPVRILKSGGRVQSISSLNKLNATYSKVTGTALLATNGTEYLLSDDVIVYKKIGYDYTVMPVSELSVNSYRITAYADRNTTTGGKVRVIVAEEK